MLGNSLIFQILPFLPAEFQLWKLNLYMLLYKGKTDMLPSVLLVGCLVCYSYGRIAWYGFYLAGQLPSNGSALSDCTVHGALMLFRVLNGHLWQLLFERYLIYGAPDWLLLYKVVVVLFYWICGWFATMDDYNWLPFVQSCKAMFFP